MSDKEQRQKKIREQMVKKKKYYQECFAGEAGEFVLDDLKKACYMEYTTFSKDSNEMAYREGIRSVYLHILRKVKEVKL